MSDVQGLFDLVDPEGISAPDWRRLPEGDVPYFCDSPSLPDAGRLLGKLGKRDYRRLHLEKLALAESLRAAGREDVADQLQNCCTQLYLDRYSNGVRIRGLNECKHPLCPTAQLARARRLYGQISCALEDFFDKNDGLQGVLLTLTAQSCPAHELRYRLGELLAAFSRLTRFARFKRAVKAFVRSVEFTRNPITGLWHPHIHVCILVSKAEYFRRGSKFYITQDEWASLWKKALRAIYKPVVDIRILKGLTSPLTDKGREALCEVIKYQLKPGSLTYWQDGKAFAVGRREPELYRRPGDKTLQPMLNVPVIAFCDAVKGRRLVATSRNLQGNEDLDFTDDPMGPVKSTDLGEFICTEVYQWHTIGRQAGFYLVERSFEEPTHSRQGVCAMGP